MGAAVVARLLGVFFGLVIVRGCFTTVMLEGAAAATAAFAEGHGVELHAVGLRAFDGEVYMERAEFRMSFVDPGTTHLSVFLDAFAEAEVAGGADFEDGVGVGV